MSFNERYTHTTLSNKKIELPVGKTICVGRNYLDHIHELNNSIPEKAVLFMKPSSAFCSIHGSISLPKNRGACHNEIEIALLIKDDIPQGSRVNVEQQIWGIALGLDLTLRDVQSDLKAKGLPWERAKSFDGSCPLSQFVPLSEFETLTDIDFTLQVNGELRQRGNTQYMLRPIVDLLNDILEDFSLSQGDVVLTGTPAGVGALNVGDKLDLLLANRYKFGCEAV